MNRNLLRRILSALLVFTLLSTVSPAFAAEASTIDRGYYWNGEFNVEGKSVYFNDGHTTYDPIQYNGNLYIPLPCVGEWAASTARWEPELKQISLQSVPGLSPHFRGKDEQLRITDEEFEVWLAKWQNGLENGFEITLLPDTTVLKDGEEVVASTSQGSVLSPIVYEGIPYLSVRTAAQLIGKTPLYMDYLYSREFPCIFLYQAPTAAQLSASRSYFLELDLLIRNGWHNLSDIRNANDISQLNKALVQTKEDLLQIKAVPIPDLPILECWVHDSLFLSIDRDDLGIPLLERHIDWTVAPQSHPDPYGTLTLDSARRTVYYNTENTFFSLFRTLTAMRVFTEAMAAEELK